VVPTVSVASPCKTETEDNCEYGTLTDDRDGQTYKTVKIGDQWWMAENLNYRYIQQTFEGAEEDSSSYCYNDDPAIALNMAACTCGARQWIVLALYLVILPMVAAMGKTATSVASKFEAYALKAGTCPILRN
jgi:hypothetical protein